MSHPPSTSSLAMSGSSASSDTWSAVLREATLVSGPTKNLGSVPDFAHKLTTCGDRSWSEDLYLRLRFDRPLPSVVLESIPDPSGKKMQPLLVVSAHERFGGIYRTFHADADGMCVLCFVKKYEGSSFEPVLWRVQVPKNGETNVCIGTKGRVAEMEAEGVGHRTQESMVSIAPPLRFHSRMTMFHLDEINTVAQTFRADVFCEFRLRGISFDPDENLVKTLLEAYAFREDMLEVMMATEIISQERWSDLTKSGTFPRAYDYSLKMRTRAVFAEEYELQEFPFDEQDLQICVTMNIPFMRAEILENSEFPSVMMHRTFQQKSVFDIVYDDVLRVVISKSDPSESGAGFVYPRCTFNTVLSRNYSYYIYNVYLPMAVLTYVTSASMSVETDGQSLSTADRLSVTLTILVI
jgi:hypothetical protein